MSAAGNSDNFSGTSSNLPAPLLRMLALGDINSDGIPDFVGRVASPSGIATPLRLALGSANGSFNANVQLFNGTPPEFVDPRVVVGDFTGDGRADIAVYDAGTYDWSLRLTLGREPVLLVGGADGKFTASSALKDAMRPLLQPADGYRGGKQADLTVGIKDVAAADIDGDGDLDLWVESTGSANITSHFMINSGGTFTVDLNKRLPEKTLFGPGYGSTGDYYRYGIGRLVEANGDGRPDLLLGQIRDNDPTHIGQSSFVVLNDGTGNYPQANQVRLPLPDFYHGYTAVVGATTGDINRDGRNDLVLIHTRNDDVSGDAVLPPWTGTWIQVLVQSSNGQFLDETATRIGSQADWSASTLPQYEFAQAVVLSDVNDDGLQDLVLSYQDGQRPSASHPVLFLAGPDGRFTATNPDLLTGGDQYFGEGLRPLDINNDGQLDFVHLDSAPGGDGVYTGDGTDDYSILVTQLGTQPLGGPTQPTYAGKRADYVITKASTGFAVVEAGSTQTYPYAARLHFSDMSVALDISGNAGTTAKVLGAVFGKTALANKAYVGIGLDLLDDGMNYQSLMQLALNARLGAGASHEAVVNLLYTNVTGKAPDAATLNMFRGLLDSGTHTPASLGMLAADHALNQVSINLVGFATTGIEYLPHG